MESLGKKLYNNAIKKLNEIEEVEIKSLSNKNLLDYLVIQFHSEIKKINSLDDVKNQDIIVRMNKDLYFRNHKLIVEQATYFRRVGDNIYNTIVTVNNKEYITNKYADEVKVKFNTTTHDYYIIKVNAVVANPDEIIYHGSRYKYGMINYPDEFSVKPDGTYMAFGGNKERLEYRPYNYIGNWFSGNADSVAGYAVNYDDNLKIRVYKYKIREQFNVINLIKESNDNYWKHQLMFVKTLVRDQNIFNITSQTRLHCLDGDVEREERQEESKKNKEEKKCADGKTSISKFNYTNFRNLRNLKKPSAAGLYNYEKMYNKVDNKLSDDGEIEMKCATSGDGDKIFSSELCYLYHNQIDNDYNINGWKWEEGQINHFMICDTTKIDLISASKDMGFFNNRGTFIEKGTKEFLDGDYFKKYLKYKNKYIKLKKILQSS